MADQDVLAQEFEQHRAHLRAVAYRMLGSSGDAEDAVQESWLRLSRSDPDAVDLRAWLTTVVARVCLDMIRQRSARRELAVDQPPEPVGEATTPAGAASPDPEQEAVLADSVGVALLVVLGTLAPAERLAFVLHDLFAVPFEQIAPIVGRSPAATRQLASRARRRVQGADPAERDDRRQREVVTAFLTASRSGDFAALMELLDPATVLTADAAAVAIGAQPELRGAPAVAGRFAGGARVARLATVDGRTSLVWMHRGSPKVVFDFTVDAGRVTAIELVAEPAALELMQIAYERGRPFDEGPD